MLLAEASSVAQIFVFLFAAFALALVLSLRRGPRRRRLTGTPALDGVWEFLHQPEETLGAGETTVRGELPDGREAEVHVGMAATPILDFAVEMRAAAPFLFNSEDKTLWAGDRDWPGGVKPAPGARRALATLFLDYGLEDVHFESGRLRARRVLENDDRLRETPRILALLGVVAHALDPPREVEVHVGFHGHAAIRCSYCHGGLATEEVTRACDGCGTVLHMGCWEELGRCPMLGCQGKTPERSPVH